ncbi:MAG: hypothetical protein F7C35_01815 [Desulfurococcales archaeon]|nr:hypothetical protein [Desulfurococcales archaeon]
MEALLDVAWRLLSGLGAWPAYRIVHSFPSALQGLAYRLTRGRCPEPLGLRVKGLRAARLANPVGLAAGLNKDGNLTWLGDALCLGFTVVGSVLPYKYGGAGRKVLLRITPEAAINRLGLPSRGVDRVKEAVSKYETRYTTVAWNAAGLRIQDYREVVAKIGGLGAWAEVNISCPNTEEHGTFEKPDVAVRVASTVREVSRIPLLLKIPNTDDRDLLHAYADVVRESGMAGIVAGNTSKFYVRGVQAGLSGAPIYYRVRRAVRVLRELLPGEYVVVGVGGVTRPERAVELLEEGADLVEILTALLRLGPGRVREIVWAAWRAVGRR